MKKALTFLLTALFVMSLSALVYANEEKSAEQVVAWENIDAIKSAEVIVVSLSVKLPVMVQNKREFFLWWG